jgi:hypothetical protein
MANMSLAPDTIGPPVRAALLEDLDRVGDVTTNPIVLAAVHTRDDEAASRRTDLHRLIFNLER